MAHPGWGEQWGTPSVPAGAPPVPTSSGRPRRGTRGARSRRPLRVALLVTLGVLLVVVALGAWFVRDALQARDALMAAADDVSRMQELVTAGDVAGAEAVVPGLQEHAAEARERTDGPLWSVARALPWAGPNVSAVQTVASVVDDLAQRALPPLVQATAVVDPAALAPVDGRLDVAPIAAIAPQVTAADGAVRGAVEQLAAIDSAELLEQIAAPVDELRDKVAAVAADTATASRAVQLLPAMLGAEGPRQYLVLVQNNAEPRATGGIAGAVLLLRVQDGAIEVVEQRTGGELAGLAQPVVELTPAEQDLFGPLLATDMRDVNFTPDFPRSARIAQRIWQQEVGAEVDGVLSVDPGTLALVLRATGPVALPTGGALTADDAAARLLNQVYLDIEDPRAQDAYFAATAAAVFAAVAGGQGDPAAAVDALAEAARQGRLMVWSAAEDEQALLEGTVLAGELRGSAADSPVVGVFLNDATQAKVGYYLDVAWEAEAVECRPDGSQLVQVRGTYRYAPPENVDDLPEYVLGPARIVPPGQLRVNALVYVPENGHLESLRVNSEETPVHAQIHDELSVAALTWTFEPGQTRTLVVDLVTRSDQKGDVLIRSTPLAHSGGNVTAVSSCAANG
ncbi:DUF4012 domain-containing protein [Cellulomonas sp. JZ18]|uniref:DUF4012 domain-containing protein n=1 Tax=Cellulomonas sp. JZ18 TaxID=2654191 RepID=UPI0012D3FE2C|nr:DUF4012 domain-containing protein [Cellulomonas sp. JZ18]QGQ20266.1 DUF4012 domain-containing protein [Cellulomonas sp. JZ18]